MPIPPLVASRAKLPLVTAPKVLNPFPKALSLVGPCLPICGPNLIPFFQPRAKVPIPAPNPRVAAAAPTPAVNTPAPSAAPPINLPAAGLTLSHADFAKPPTPAISDNLSPKPPDILISVPNILLIISGIFFINCSNAISIITLTKPVIQKPSTSTESINSSNFDNP